VSRRALALSAPVALVTTLFGCAAVLGIPSDIEQVLPGEGGPDAPISTMEGGPEAGEDHFVPSDASLDGDADAGVMETDAGPQCDPIKDFDAPIMLSSVGTNASEGSARLSEDETIIYFSKVSVAPDFGIYMATRVVLTDSFFGITPIPGAVNTSDYEYSPNITDNGLTIFYEHQSAVSGDSDIYMATRAAANGSFGAGVPVPGVNSNPGYDAKPYVRGDGSELYFVKDTGAGGTADIMLATQSGATYTIAPVPGVNDPAVNDYSPVVTRNGLKMYFSSVRPSGGPAGYNIWVAVRANIGDPFNTPVLVSNVNSDAYDEPNWISADDCRLYMSSQRGGKQHIYVARRPK
jgi:hypothetical protein